MRFFGQILAVLFSLALLGTLGVGGYYAFRFIVDLFHRMDFQVATVIAIASVVALLAAKIIAGSIREAGKHNKAQQPRAEKTASYQKLINAWEDYLREGCNLDLQNPGRHSEDLHAVEQLLILYGAPGVVKAHGTLRAFATKLGSRRPEVVSQLATLLMEMRKDLGTGSQNLKAEDLLQLLQVDSENSSERPKAPLCQDHRPRVSLAPNGWKVQ